MDAIQSTEQYVHTANQHAFLEDILKDLRSQLVRDDPDSKLRRELALASLQGQIADLEEQMVIWQGTQEDRDDHEHST